MVQDLADCISAAQCMRKFKRCLRGRGEGTGKRIIRWWICLLPFEDRESRKGKIAFFFLALYRIISFSRARIDSRVESGGCLVHDFREHGLKLFGEIFC